HYPASSSRYMDWFHMFQKNRPRFASLYSHGYPPIDSQNLLLVHPNNLLQVEQAHLGCTLLPPHRKPPSSRLLQEAYRGHTCGAHPHLTPFYEDLHSDVKVADYREWY